MYFCQTHAVHAQNMHATAQCYCIILKPPRGRSKPESTLRAEASETQVADSPSVPEEDIQATKKTYLIVTKEKLLCRCTIQNTSFVGLLLYA